MARARVARNRADAIVKAPSWYRYRSAVFAAIYALGFLGGWGVSAAMHGRYLVAFTDIGSPWGNRGIAIAAAIALAIAIAAISLRVWGASYLSASTVWEQKAQTDVLVQSGPFAFVRHPLYLGNLLLALGLGAAAPVAGWAFIFIASVFFVNALIRYEERGLEQRHGDAYDAYRHAVPSLLPRLSPLRTGQNIRPSLAQGLRAEAFTSFLILGVVGIFAVPRYGAAVFVACYLIGVFVQRRLERA